MKQLNLLKNHLMKLLHKLKKKNRFNDTIIFLMKKKRLIPMKKNG